MATPRRRSARLRQGATPERSAVKKVSTSENKLGSLIERDETPEPGVEAHQNIDTIITTPNGPPNTDLRDRFAQLSALKTPTTIPRPSHADMHPENVHKSTAKAPDSGLRLGFADISTKRNKSLAEAQNTPTKAQSPAGVPKNLSSPGFEFKFSRESNLSREAQRMMENVRDEAARIKEQMRKERDEQERKDDEAEAMFGTVGATGRKIAQPKGRVGRFSDVHMAEFKKMDSIANHPSAFRAQPGFLKPTGQSLKRSSSKAELNEPERPRTAGKTLSPVKAATTPRRRMPVKSPFKSGAPSFLSSGGAPKESPTKRPRLQQSEETSSKPETSQPITQPVAQSFTVPRSGFGFSSHLFTPTKASMARSSTMKELGASPEKPSMLPKSASSNKIFKSAATPSSPALASVVKDVQSTMPRDKDAKEATMPKSSSKLPKFTGLKSILRRHQPLISNDPIKIAAGTHIAPPSGSSKVGHHLNSLSSDGIGTPDRRMTVGPATPSIKKHVEFTPNTIERHEAILASPSPVKAPVSHGVQKQGGVYPSLEAMNSAFVMESDIQYPTLTLEESSEPSSPVAPTNKGTKIRQPILSRHEPGFKSIFTTLHPRPPPSSLVFGGRQSRSPSSSPLKASPSTIRQVRESGFTFAAPVQPFEDLKTVPHGLPGKKRRRQSDDDLDKEAANHAVKDVDPRRASAMPAIPGGFPTESPKDADGPASKRRKTRRLSFGSDGVVDVAPPAMKENVSSGVTSPKKPSIARVTAANAAKDRKVSTGRGILTMARLNMLSRPKDRR